jgi:hypothetical protein
VADVEVVYSRDLDDKDMKSVRAAVDPRLRQVAAQLTRWVDQTRAISNKSSLFDRAAYVPSENVYDQMKMARSAVSNDDIVGGVAEITEGLAFDGVKWESDNADDADVFNQMAGEQDLDAVVRRIWREEFTYGACVLGFWWDHGEFKVRGKTKNGNARKATRSVWYPKAITTLDATKVVPVGMMQFGQERLAWHASQLEIAQYCAVLDGVLEDELMTRFYAGQYMPSDVDEIQELSSLKVDVNSLILLNDEIIKRHTLTKPDHLRFPDVRLKRVFKLLDLKQQLMDADRVSLIGAANYILLVRKGDKDDPAYPEEVQNLKENFDLVAKIPVVISDHRLQIDIITPSQDYTLDVDKYDVIDNRIASSLLGLFGAVGSKSGNRSDSSLQEARLVARNLENRRHMIRRFLEKNIARAIVNHPNNDGVFEGGEPNLTFVPKNIALDADAGAAASIIQLRTMNELSRESTLEYFGFDQAVERMRRILEDEGGADDDFQTIVPFNSPDNNGTGKGAASGGATATKGVARANVPAARGAAGARGGRPKGGGQPTRNPAKATQRTAKGTTKPAKGK